MTFEKPHVLYNAFQVIGSHGLVDELYVVDVYRVELLNVVVDTHQSHAHVFPAYARSIAQH